MIFYELTTYTLKPGSVPAFLQLFARLALPALRRLGAEPVTNCFSVIGPVNQVVQLWRVEGAAPLAAKRAALASEPAWATFLAEVAPLIVSEASQILVAAPTQART